jgi:hypothetical protein
MELHELKDTWTVLDEKKKKNEMLNKQIIKEMLQKKSNKSLNRLINTDFVNLALCLLAIPVSIWGYHKESFANLLFPKILFAVIGITMILVLIWSYFPLKNLIKIDFSKSIKNNMYHINKYTINLKKEKIAVYFGFIPIYVILGILCYYEFKVDFLHWTLLIVGCLFGTVMTYWMYKRIYDSSIQSIKQSLEELEELEDK